MKPLAADDPRVIGEYRLRARLGAGGMGRVYLGLSPAGRAVAIKVVHPDLAVDTEFLRRFGQEVAAARAVSGIYTAPVVASGLNERPPWLATAFVPGPSLDEVVTEHGPLPGQALRSLLGGLVEALQAIHACRVVHRDLKPANVLLATDGPRVIDFGISRAADGTALTAAGIVFGTPGYMSPEQAEGKPAGPASDVFALGCVIAYAATGAGPFGGGTAAAILYRVVHSEPALDVGPGMPPRLREVISRCLVKDPAARPSPRALAAAIASGMDAAGPSAVSFWPRSVANLIGAYQARLERETTAASRPADAFSWGSGSTAVHPPTTPSDPGSSKGPRWPPQPPAPGGTEGPEGPAGSPGPRWPYGGSDPKTPENPNRPPGYGGAQPSPPAPRGYLPASAGESAAGGLGSGRANYPQGSRAPRGPMPPSMLNAVRLMYAGAAYALIAGIHGLIVTSSGLSSGGGVEIQRTFGRVHVVSGPVVLTEAALSCVIDVTLWLWMARKCKKGKNWARITSTVFFCIASVGFLMSITSPATGSTFWPALGVVGWLIGCSAAVFLWQRPSRVFFRASRRALGSHLRGV